LAPAPGRHIHKFPGKALHRQAGAVFQGPICRDLFSYASEKDTHYFPGRAGQGSSPQRHALPPREGCTDPHFGGRRALISREG